MGVGIGVGAGVGVGAGEGVGVGGTTGVTDGASGVRTSWVGGSLAGGCELQPSSIVSMKITATNKPNFIPASQTAFQYKESLTHFSHCTGNANVISIVNTSNHLVDRPCYLIVHSATLLCANWTRSLEITILNYQYVSLLMVDD